MVEILIVVWMDLNILLFIKERKILSVAKECNRSRPGALMNRVRRWMEEEKKKKRRKMGNKDFLLQPLLAAYSAVVLRKW